MRSERLLTRRYRDGWTRLTMSSSIPTWHQSCRTDILSSSTDLLLRWEDPRAGSISQSAAQFYSCKKAVVQYSEKIINERTAELKAGATPKTNVLDKLLNMHKGDLTWNLVT